MLVGAYDNAPELRQRIPSALPYHFFDLHCRRLKPHLAAARLLARITREHNIKVISAHGNPFAPYEIARRHKIPFVWTIHGAQELNRTLLGRLKDAAVRRIFHDQRTRIVGVSHATVEIMQRNFPSLETSRLRVIHNGIIDEKPLGQLPLPKTGPPWRLAFVGRLAERKRPLDLVKVAQRLDGKLDFTIDVFGDGPLRGALNDAIQREGLQQRFVFHGYWDQGCASMMEQFHILVHPDAQEPFGGALLEAQLSGRPVVAYRAGGNPEIVEHAVTGWLVPPANADGLADGVLVVATERFMEFSRAARARAAREFSLEKMTGGYTALFEQACASL